MDAEIKEKVIEPLSIYEQVCAKCIDDLYHTAYLVLVDENSSEKIVTEVCVAGVHKYDEMDDEAKIRFCLTKDMYHSLRRKLWWCNPTPELLPNQLKLLTKKDRLIVALRFLSGLPETESCWILGLTADAYRDQIHNILKKTKA